MSSKMKELSKRLTRSDGILNKDDLLNFFNEFLIWLNTGFNKTRPLPKGQVNKYITTSISLLLDIDPELFVNLIPIALKILVILVHPQTDKDIREATWRLSISLIDSKTKFMTPNSWTHLIESAFSKKERDPNFNSGTPSIYSYESNCNLFIIYLNIISSMCNIPNLNHDFANIKKNVIYHWELMSELIFTHIFNTSSENRRTLNLLCLQTLQCINTCQKTFKFAFLDTDIAGSQMINYLLDILLRIGKLSSDDHPNEISFKLLYKFYKLTFPCQIFTIGQNSIPYECKKNTQIAERITHTINRNYLFLTKNNPNATIINTDNNSPNNRPSLNRQKFTINPLLLCCFDTIPSDEVITLLKNMSQNCKNFSPILINSIFIMINLIHPLLIKIQSKVKLINNNLSNYLSNIMGNFNGNSNNNDSNSNINTNTVNLKAIDKVILSFTTSEANLGVISSVAQLFSHTMRLRSLMQVIIKSSIDSSTFSAIISLFFNIQKREMYPFLVTFFFTILFDRRLIDAKKERDYILLLMSFKFNMSYMPNLFARIASQISVALSTFILNISKDESSEIQSNPILFDEKEITNEPLVEIGKFSTDSLFFFFPFISNDFSTQTAKEFIINMINSFDLLFNNYVSISVTGAILSIIEWIEKKVRSKSSDQKQQQLQLQQQRILERNLRLNLRKKRNRPKSHDFQSIRMNGIRSSEYQKLSSSSLILPSTINESSLIINRSSNLEINDSNASSSNLICNDESNLSANSLPTSSPQSLKEPNLHSHSASNIFNLKSIEDKNNNNNNNNGHNITNTECSYQNPFYIDNILYSKDLDLSFLFGYLLPYLMKALVKSLDLNDEEAQEENNKKLNYFMSWFEEKPSSNEIQTQNPTQNDQKTEQEKSSNEQKNHLQNMRIQCMKKMQIICFNVIFKAIKLAHKFNLLTEKLARDWCKLLIIYINNCSANVLNEVVLVIIECVLNAYPLSFSLIPVLSQAFCKVDFASFQDKDKRKIISYLVSVCSMIKKTIDKSKISFLIKNENAKRNNKNNANSKCSFVDIRADTFAVLAHAFEGLEGVSENIDAAAFSLFIDDLYSTDDTMFNLTETLVFSRLAHFEKQPSLTFCRLLLSLFPTHLDMVLKKCSKNLFNHLIEAPFNVLLKQDVKNTEIFEILSQCLVDIILTLQNGPIFNKTLAFITVETVPDENQKILSERTKFLISNFKKPNGVIDITININSNNDKNIRPKHSYYAISHNGAFYCVRNYRSKKNVNNDNEFFIVESSLPLGSSRYKITPSHFLTVPQKSKFESNLKNKLNNVPEKPRNIPNNPQKVCMSSNSYMFSQVPSSALLFKVLSHFSQSTLKFSTSLKSVNRARLQASQSTEADVAQLNTLTSFSVIPKPTKLLTIDINTAGNTNNATSSSLNNNISEACQVSSLDDKLSIKSKSMNNIELQRCLINDQKILLNARKVFKRSQRAKHAIGVIYMEKEQILNLNADYCLNSSFFDSELSSSKDSKEDATNNNDNDDAEQEKTSKGNNSSSFDEMESLFVDSIIEEKISFMTQTHWKETSPLFKEFISSLGSFQRRGRFIRKKQATSTTNINEDENQNSAAKTDKVSISSDAKTKDNDIADNDDEISKTEDIQNNDITNDMINIHYVDFHSDVVFLIGPFLGIQSFQNTMTDVSASSSSSISTTNSTSNSLPTMPSAHEIYNNNCKMKNSFWRYLKNSHVMIIWNEDNSRFDINYDQNNNTNNDDENNHNIMRVFIVISPTRNNLFKVSVIENFNQKQLLLNQQQQIQQIQQQQLQGQLSSQFLIELPKVEELLKISPGPLFGDTIVPKRSLGELIRATAIYEDQKVKSLIENIEKVDLYIDQVIQEIERKKKGKKYVFSSNNTQLFDIKNQRNKKKKVAPSDEKVFSELWKDFPDSFNFFY